MSLRASAYSVTNEFELHVFTAELLKLYSTVPWWHVPNGEYRSKRTAARLKKMGVRRGVPDFHLILPPNGRSAFLELKSSTGRMSDDQRIFQMEALGVGSLYAIAATPERVAETLFEFGALRENPLHLNRRAAA